MKNCVLQKKNIFFLHVHELDIVQGVNMDQISRVGKVCSPKKFFKVRNLGNFVIIWENTLIFNENGIFAITR